MTQKPTLVHDDKNRSLISLLRLIRTPRIGPKTTKNLIEEYGSAVAAIDALPEKLRAAGRDPAQIGTEIAARHELRIAAQKGIHVLGLGLPNYPKGLEALSNAPPILFLKGDINLLKRKRIGIVGARNASALGLRFAHQLARDLSAAGFCVTSGLARGIDAAAHHGSLERGTLAVQAGGLDVVFPQENAGLQHQIHAHGLSLSEHRLDTYPQARHFPRRNHILAALCDAVIVVEAAISSGTMITAQAAADLGREVFAVPGHPFDSRASGSNILIRDGAHLIRSAQDVMDVIAVEPYQLNLSDVTPHQQIPQTLAPIAESAGDLLGALDETPTSEEILIAQSGIARGEALRQIAEEEVLGRIRRHQGGLISRVA